EALGLPEPSTLNSKETFQISLAVHAHIAAAPCRLAVMQLDDVLGATIQPNMPGTTSEHPNWRVKLPVPLENLAGDPAFVAHVTVMRQARSRD
ncbi:MAG: 4-alpha-glucanotransferase, partial [Pseudomonadota bacterium]